MEKSIEKFENIKKMTTEQLKYELKKIGQPTNGNKSSLKKKLLDTFERNISMDIKDKNMGEVSQNKEEIAQNQEELSQNREELAQNQEEIKQKSEWSRDFKNLVIVKKPQRLVSNSQEFLNASQ